MSDFAAHRGTGSALLPVGREDHVRRDLLELLTAALCQISGSERGALLAVEGRTPTLRVVASRGLGEMLAGTTLALGDYPSLARVLEAGEEQPHASAQLNSDLAVIGVESCLCIALRTQREVIGLAALESTAPAMAEGTPGWNEILEASALALKAESDRRNVQITLALDQADLLVDGLHHTLAQTIFAVGMLATGLREATSAEERREGAARISHLATLASRELRAARRALRSGGPGSDLPFAAAIEELGSRAGVPVVLEGPAEIVQARHPVNDLLRRICHSVVSDLAEAKRLEHCRIRCTVRDSVMTATVECALRHGGGDGSLRHFGLRYLEELVRQAGGSLTLSDLVDRVVVEVQVPADFWPEL